MIVRRGLIQPVSVWAVRKQVSGADMVTIASRGPSIDVNCLFRLHLACLQSTVSGQLPRQSSTRGGSHQKDAEKYRYYSLHSIRKLLMIFTWKKDNEKEHIYVNLKQTNNIIYCSNLLFMHKVYRYGVWSVFSLPLFCSLLVIFIRPGCYIYRGLI